MKVLDKYVARSFLTGYAIAFCVLIGLRILIDLFVNLDEFVENADLGAMRVAWNILAYYGVQSVLYFRDFAGTIIVVAAVFSLGRMIRANELTAVMSSGVSLKRVIAPIVILSLVLTGLLVVDQELVIPPLGAQLVRSHDAVPGEETYNIWFITDANGSLICSQSFDVKTSTLRKPTIITRQKQKDSLIWQVTGRIDAEKAVFNSQTERWDLEEGVFTSTLSEDPASRAKYYVTDLKPADIPIRCESRDKTLLSSRQLAALAAQGAKVRDLQQLYSQKHFRITDPIMSMVMLMVSLPILVCRDPKAMKSAVMISFLLTGACMLTGFACKMFATEALFDKVMPEFWAWLPVFIFLPVAILELDSMKT